MKGLLLALVLLSMAKGLENVFNEIPRIGIIGGGIGGTSCAYFLKSLFKRGKVHIDLYEAEKIGGRLSLAEFSNKKYEEGGSIIHSRNKYMTDFLKKFKLRKRHSCEGYFGLFNGQEFVFTESEWRLATMWHMIRRYGFGLWKLRSYIDDMLLKFDRIYELQKSKESYNTVGSLLAAMDPTFATYLHITTETGFKKQGFSREMLDEVIMATIRANYGQNLQIHKMVGSVSVSCATGSLWAVKGGNTRIPKKLLAASGAKWINRPVDSVERLPSGQLRIFTSSTPEVPFLREVEPMNRTYDAVIVATPQTSDSKYLIKFKNFDEDIKFPGVYHKTVSTLVEGNLCRKRFPGISPIIDEILTTKDDVPFNSIGLITPVDAPSVLCNTSRVWKVFTQEKMNEQQLSFMFTKIKNVHVREWLAYPRYTASKRNDTFVLSPNLFHVNAIEWAASAMEMSAIGAKNVALLAYKSLTAKKKQETENFNKTESESNFEIKVKEEL